MEAKKEPAVSFETVCDWFDRAAVNAKAQGKVDASLLWQDGLEHLRHLQSQRNDLVNSLQEIVRNDPYNQSSAGVIARAALANVGA